MNLHNSLVLASRYGVATLAGLRMPYMAFALQARRLDLNQAAIGAIQGGRRPWLSGIRISMQSVGHTGAQRSHPVHRFAITVCILPLAPTIASTGHTRMHLVHPIHSLSTISATSLVGRLPSPPAAPGSRPSMDAIARRVASPPGGHKEIDSFA